MTGELSQSIRRTTQSIQAERPAPRRRRSFQPCLALLEDRCVPSTLTVTSSADDVTQNHTLRYAVTHAQSGDTIQLTAAIKDPIVLTNGELVLSQNVTIQSVPAQTPTISGDGISRVFEIAPGAHVNLNNLKIIDGNGVADNPSGSTLFVSPVGGDILNLGTLNVSSLALSGNSSSYGAGIYNFYGGTLTVSQSTLSNNNASGLGGGIYNDYGGSTTLADSTLTGNTAGSGGGIDNDGTLAVNGSTLTGNSAAEGDGGAIVNGSTGSASVSDSTLSGNSAQYAGGIFNVFGAVSVSHSTLSGNSDLFGAGGIFNLFGAVSVSDSTLSGNSSIYSAGGINNTLGLLTVSDSTLSGNTAYVNNAGGIFNYFSSTMVLTDTNITGNSCGGYGGGISTWGTAIITGGSIDNNTAAFGGGAIDNFIGSLAISGTTIQGNTAGTDGGGIHNYAATLSVSDCTISDNTAERGGAVYNGGDIFSGFGAVTVNDSTLSGNSAFAGGGIFNDGASTATVTGCTLSDNTAIVGGAIFNDGILNVGTSKFSGNTPDDIEGGYNDLGGNTF